MDSQTQVRERAQLRHCPSYRVLLHNDDHNGMDHVVRALLATIPRMTADKASAVMWEAHLTGLALVIVAPQEHAEFYQEQLMSFGLTATIEPVE